MDREIKKVVHSSKKVRFSDCDPFNHLNNSKYIDYFLNAREDHVEEQFGLNIYSMAWKTGTSWIVGTNQIMYLRPALLSEQVILESQLIDFSDKKILVEMRMFDAEKKQLKSFMWSDFIYIQLKSGKSHHHEDNLMEMFKSAHAPVEQSTFKMRSAFLMRMGS
jgi:acyl-CoA thioester hydrolase